MTVTERKDTVLYRLKTRPQRICEVKSLMANGLDGWTRQQLPASSGMMTAQSSAGSNVAADTPND